MSKKIITIIVVGLVGLPMAAAASTIEDQQVVTGHTVYANLGGFDPDVALIAGLVENKVVWFNGQTVLSTLGSGFVYTVEADQCTPLSGTNYVFQDYRISYRDPNNVSHVVAHYTYECGDAFQSPLEVLTNATQHVWVTLTHNKTTDPAVRPGPTGGRIYNFGTGVDTSFFDSRGTTEHDGYGGGSPNQVNEGDSYCPAEEDHVCNEGNVPGEDYIDGPHDHHTGAVDMYFSKADKGNGTVDADGNFHPGTDEGCEDDAYCAYVTDRDGIPKDPEDVWNGSPPSS